MTKKYKMNKPNRFFSILLYLLCCCLLPAGCIDETYDSGTAGTSLGKVRLSFRIPGFPTAGGSTRIASPQDEYRADPAKTHLLLFAELGEKFIFYRYADNVESTPAAGHRHTLEIPFYEGEFNRRYRLMVVSNLTLDALEVLGGGAGFPTFTACNGHNDPMDAVRRLLTYGSPDTSTGRWPIAEGHFMPLPFWAETAPFAARPGQDLGTLSLVRALARIDVGIRFARNDEGKYTPDAMASEGLWDGDNYFKLVSVSLYNAPLSGYIAPAGGVAVTGAHADANALKDIRPDAPRRYTEADLSVAPGAASGDEADNRRALTRALYVPETRNKELPREQAVCLVIGGQYGKGNPTTYYRIDFYDRTLDADGNIPKPTPENRIDLIRNQLYVVNIVSVGGPGAPTEEDALHADYTTSMEVELTGWSQGDTTGDITSDGQYTLSLDKTEQSYYADGLPQDFILQTDYDGKLGNGWKMEADSMARECVVFYTPEGAEIHYGDPLWPSKGAKGITNLRIGMDPFPQPAGTTVVQSRRAVLTFIAGRMKVKCILSQTSREMLTLHFNPDALNFPLIPLYSRPVEISASTRRPYALAVTWSDEAGATYSWNIKTAGGTPPLNPSACPDARFTAANFFAPESGGKGYLLRPEPNTTGSPRTFVFNISATVPETGTSVANTLYVYQSERDVTWTVSGGTGIRFNEVEVEYNAPSVTPQIAVRPFDMEWYFTRDALPAPWISNLDAVSGKLYQGGKSVTLYLNPNLALGRRTHELPARSDLPGFDPDNSVLKIVQLGLPLVLQPRLQNNPTAIGPPVAGPDGKQNIYVLDYGLALNPNTGQAIGITSNTDWQWQWDRSVHTRALSFERGLKEMFGTSFAPTPPEQTPTTGGPADGTTQKEWLQAFAFDTTDETLRTDDDLWSDRQNVPLAGTHELQLELRNNNTVLHPADVERYKKKIKIKRTFPAYQHVAHWPYADGDNLDLYRTEIMAGAETPLRVRTNATGRIEYHSGSAPNNLTLQEYREVAAQSGYEEFTQTLKALGVPIDANSVYKPKTWVKLRYTGPRRDHPTGVDNPGWAEERTYYYGTEIKIPERNMNPRNRLISNTATTLWFDFKASTYARLKVRVSLRNVNTAYGTAGVTGTDAAVTYIGAGGENGYELTWPDTRFSVALPANTATNLLKVVGLEYYSVDAAGNGIWKTDASPVIIQDCQPAPGGFVVCYNDYPTQVEGGIYTSNVINKNPTTWTDGNYVEWMPVTALHTLMTPTNLANAVTSVTWAKNNGRANCTTQVNTQLQGYGETNLGYSSVRTRLRSKFSGLELSASDSFEHKHTGTITMAMLGTVSNTKYGTFLHGLSFMGNPRTVGLSATCQMVCCGKNLHGPRKGSIPVTKENGFKDFDILDKATWEDGMPLTWRTITLAKQPSPCVRWVSPTVTTGATTYPQQ